MKAQIKLGFAPTRRAIFSAPAAVEYRNLTAKRLRELGIDFVDIDDINEEGLLYDDAGLEKIIEKHPDIANKFCHIVIVPKENTEMKVDAEKFGFSLKQEFINGYKIIDPSDFLLPVKDLYPELIEYLESRYW